MAKKEVDEKEGLKVELIDYLKSQVDIEVEKAVRKADNKLLRQKSRIIFGKNIIIILLLAVILFGVYYLYKDHYFDKYFTKVEYVEKEKTTTKVDTSDTKKEEEVIDYNKDYGHYLDNYIITENCDYLKDFYKGDLTDELKLYLSVSLMGESSFTIEDKTIVLSADAVKSIYTSLFDLEFMPISFKYNGVSFKYLASQNMFIGEGEKLNQESNIKRDIIKVEEQGSILRLTVLEAIVKDDVVYNVLNNKKIGKYKNGLKDYQKQVNTIVYEFTDNTLTKIEKE
jgi:hypothetical protein